MSASTADASALFWRINASLTTSAVTVSSSASCAAPDGRRRSSNGRDVALNEARTAQACEADTPDAARSRARGQCWAALMRRTLGFDVLACPRCGGRLRLIALIEEAAVIDRILRHLGLPTETPAPRPARAPPRLALVPDAVCWDDDAAVFDPCS